jgi:hypothetical protein
MLAALGTAKAKHAIKRVDVLLGNEHLLKDTEAIQRHFVSLMKGRTDRPVMLIDWTDIGPRWTSVVVTYASEGRGLTLCWEVCAIGRKNSPLVETQVLSRLAKLMAPYDVKPIIVSDAGFRGPWLRKVAKRNWDFVSRVRGQVSVRSSDGDEWVPVKALWPAAKRHPIDLGLYELAKYNPVAVRLVILKPKGKKWRSTEELPAVARRKKRNIKSAREPLVLATSLKMPKTTAKAIAEFYALRWQIELTFRDQKSGSLGIGLDDVRTKQLKRIKAYMLLASLAHYVAFVTGAAAERAGLAPDFQANTERKRRVLSYPRLGAEVLRQAALDPLKKLATLLNLIDASPPLFAY